MVLAVPPLGESGRVWFWEGGGPGGGLAYFDLYFVERVLKGLSAMVC